ncbi:thioesterase II family protein [Actinoplanes missouriensis]|uniref:thioesterase II family protein n=1 Tax=Actinoplanes missouriensis TaxID=1866 RepID=UPI0002E0CDCA|nr:alpha/beta fold hydrolase [Actinoplanes missouriensis]
MGSWFGRDVTPAAAAQLFCLPHAGAGASTYRQWQALAGPEVAVVPVRLPARESRFGEPPIRSAAAMADALLHPLMDRAGERRFALFGHSMGALLGYELAQRLTRLGRPPAHLVVSGYAAPHLSSPSGEGTVHQLSDPDLVDHLKALDGTAGEVLNEPKLLELLLPVIRADYELCETYRYPGHPPLPVPITALGGTEDPDLGEGRLQAWRELTTAAFTVVPFTGGHFYLNEHLDEVVGIARDASLRN